MFGIDGIFIGGGRGTDGERVLLQKEGGEECCDKGEPGAWGDICWGKGIVKGMEVGLGWMWWEGAFSDFDGDLFVFFGVDDDEQVLKDSLEILDVFLIVINALPFVVFLFHMVKRFVVGAKNKTNGADGKADDNSSTKILPMAPKKNQQSQTAVSDAQAIRTFS